MLKKFIRFVQNRTNKPTIAPANELNMEGKAVPSPQKESSPWSPNHTWPEIMQITDPLECYLKLGEFASMKGIEQGYDTLTEPEKIVYQIWMLETEVNNGGFDQYFFNSSGDFALETLETLRLIGSVEAVNLLGQAIKLLFEDAPSSDQKVRSKQMEAQSDEQMGRLDELDNKFSHTLEEKLYELVVSYLRIDDSQEMVNGRKGK